VTHVPPPTDTDAPAASPPSNLRALPAPTPVAAAAPSSFEAEREVLAAVFVDTRALDVIRDILTPEQFHWERHQLVYRAMLDLVADKIPVDPVLLSQRLQDCGDWERVGGVRTIGELLDRVGSLAHVEHYCGVVRTKWAHRELLSLAERVHEVGQHGYDLDESMAAVDRAHKLTLRRIDGGRKSVTSIGAVAAQHEAMVEATTAAVESGTTLAVPFGLRPLDDALNGGLWKGEQCVIMGSRSMGKSALSGQLIDANCGAGRRAIYVTLEMTQEQVVSRLISNRCRVAYIRQRSGRMTSGERDRVTEARSWIADWPLDIVEAGGWTMQRIEREVRRIIRDEGEPALAVLDYVQLVADSGEGSEATIRQASGRWAALAKEFKFASVLLTQPITSASRHEGQVPIPRPKMGDSKGSGAVPDDTDRFLVVHKPWWAPTKEQRDDVEDGLLRRAEIAIDKDRPGGNIRVIQCSFNGASMRFEEGPPW